MAAVAKARDNPTNSDETESSFPTDITIRSSAVNGVPGACKDIPGSHIRHNVTAGSCVMLATGDTKEKLQVINSNAKFQQWINECPDSYSVVARRAAEAFFDPGCPPAYLDKFLLSLVCWRKLQRLTEWFLSIRAFAKSWERYKIWNLYPRPARFF